MISLKLFMYVCPLESLYNRPGVYMKSEAEHCCNLLMHHSASSNKTNLFKVHNSARYLWLIPVILATQEAEIRRISVQRQPGQKVQENPISKKTITKKG
jgi:hypothetical protein